VGRVVDGVVCRPVADPAEHQPIRIGELQLREPEDAVVDGLVPGGRQCLPVATRHHQAARARVVDVARLDAVLGPILDSDADLARVPHITRLNATVGAASDRDAVAEGRLDCEAADAHVACPVDQHHRLGEGRHREAQRPCALGRPEEEPHGRAVDVVLARLIELAQHVDGAIPARRWVALHDTVEVRLGEGDRLRRGVDGGHADELVVPVIAPVALEPDARRYVPLARAVARVLEDARTAGHVAIARARARVDDVRDRRPALVGPARRCHPLVAAEQLWHHGRAAVGVRQLGEGLDAKGAEIDGDHVPASRRIEAAELVRIANKPAGVLGNGHAAAQAHLLARVGPIGHRCIGRSRVLRSEAQLAVGTLADLHLDAAAEQADGIARVPQGGERAVGPRSVGLRQAAGPPIAAGRGHV